VEEARRAGMKVCAHAMTDEGARNAAEGGVASIEHGFLVSDETLALAKRNGVALVGTNFTAEAAEALKMPPGMHDKAVERLRRAHKIGLKLAFGSDLFFALPGKGMGESAISYIESEAEAGLTAAEILKEMTVDAARLLGVEKERGSIRPGQAADIIATPENPLEKIDTLKRVSFVMKDGKVAYFRPPAR